MRKWLLLLCLAHVVVTITDAFSVPKKETWDKHFQELSDYKRRLKKGLLLEAHHRKSKLESVNFVAWDSATEKRTIQDLAWKQRFQALVAFQRKHGHWNVPQTHSTLAKWAKEQRTMRTRGVLTSKRRTALESIGFWEEATTNLQNNKLSPDPKFREYDSPPREQKRATWDKYFKELVCYQEENGDCNVPRSYSKNLGNWVSNQRQYRKKGTLSDEHQAKLDSIGFVWIAKPRRATQTTANDDNSWDKRFQDLVGYRRIHGDCNVPTRHSKLGSWVCNQRQVKKKGTMDIERESALESIGFLWETSSDFRTWNERYRELAILKKANDGCCIPANRLKLNRWANLQRQKRKEGSLSVERHEKLDSIGFVWEFNPDSKWNQRFQELTEYKTVTGNCNVSRLHSKLGIWVSNQRQWMKRGSLRADRKSKLDSIGFVWELKGGSKASNFDSQWNDQFELIIKYKQKHGHCNIPRNHPIGTWVMNQRNLNKKGALSSERRAKLDSIGFVWSLKVDWNDRFQELVEYKEANGNFKVSTTRTQLRTWVLNQRKLKNRGCLTSERKAKLESIGFSW